MGVNILASFFDVVCTLFGAVFEDCTGVCCVLIVCLICGRLLYVYLTGGVCTTVVCIFNRSVQPLYVYLTGGGCTTVVCVFDRSVYTVVCVFNRRRVYNCCTMTSVQSGLTTTWIVG